LEKQIFILTEDLSFFYWICKELGSINLSFKVLNIGSRFPTISGFPSIILTTYEELPKFSNLNKNSLFLPYIKEEKFEQFIKKVIAAYRIGYKKFYSKLLFSIDPGTKYIGLAVFLDDYYLNSHTIYGNQDLIEIIKDYITCFQKDNQKHLKLKFKFGRGFIAITKVLVEMLFNEFKNCKDFHCFLIDETRSSKIKILNKKKKLPIDEISALILALRDGIEIRDENLSQIFSPIKFYKLNKEMYKIKYNNNSPNEKFLRELIEKLVDGELSLKTSKEMLKNKSLEKK